ncbi:hypothetical protein V8C86DRAFT_993210 [Haematococcus lacustris]
MGQRPPQQQQHSPPSWVPHHPPPSWRLCLHLAAQPDLTISPGAPPGPTCRPQGLGQPPPRRCAALPPPPPADPSATGSQQQRARPGCQWRGAQQQPAGQPPGGPGQPGGEGAVTAASPGEAAPRPHCRQPHSHHGLGRGGGRAGGWRGGRGGGRASGGGLEPQLSRSAHRRHLHPAAAAAAAASPAAHHLEAGTGGPGPTGVQAGGGCRQHRLQPRP